MDNSQFHSIRKKIIQNPHSIINDQSIQKIDARKFSGHKLLASIAASSIMIVIFEIIFDGIGPIWKFDIDQGIVSISDIFNGYIKSFIIPLAATFSAYLTTTILNRVGDSKIFSKNDLIKYYLLSDGAYGLIPSVALALWTTFCIRLVEFQDNSGIDIWEKFNLRDDPEKLPIIIYCIFGIWAIIFLSNIYSFVKSLNLYSKIINVKNLSLDYIRLIISWIIARIVTVLGIIGIAFLFSYIIAIPVYWLSLNAREALDLKSSVHSSQVAWFVRSTLGESIIDRPPVLKSVTQTVIVDFDFGDPDIEESIEYEIEEIIEKWRSEWIKRGAKIENSGGVTIISYSGNLEENNNDDDIFLSTQRVNRMIYVLSKNGVYPNLIKYFTLPSMGNKMRRDPEQGRIEIIISIPVE